MELEAVKNGSNGGDQFWLKRNDESENDWPSFSHSGSVVSHDNGNVEETASRMSISSNKSIVSRRKSFSSKPAKGRNLSTISILNKPKMIVCPKCEYSMELPIGGVERIPKNYILARQTDLALSKIGSEQLNESSFCELCNSDVQVN